MKSTVRVKIKKSYKTGWSAEMLCDVIAGTHVAYLSYPTYSKVKYDII